MFFSDGSYQDQSCDRSNMTDISIEDLIPHRGGMKLIDEIIEVDENKAVTRAVVAETWPLFDGQAVNPMVLIELVAQTAGVCNGFERIKSLGMDSEKKGWLVGIKKSGFSIDAIPLNKQIITTCEVVFRYEKYRDMLGVSRIGQDIVGEVSLQIFQSDNDED
jgi:predicted hotdog family 3-hydroxylacyl-ACP dehydratase